MIDLRVLSHHWTEDGARSVFAELVNQCVRSNFPTARAVRPDPGDEGVDTFVGEFDGDIRVYQSKFFCEEVGKSQQAQIREAWDSCISSELLDRVVLWTLCIPIEMSPPELKWWEGWRKRESEKHKCQIELWSKTDFVNFYSRPALMPIFAIALQDGVKHAEWGGALSAMKAIANPVLLKKLPAGDHLLNAVFVRKLEAAGVTQHRGARTAFYNFELLRASIEQGGNPEEMAALEDLEERIYDLWEGEFNARPPEELGKEFFVAVEKLIAQEDQGRLRTLIPTHVIHKKGGLHYWADLCEAGWTSDFKSVAREEEPK
jgi:hypothetical protein